MFVDPLRTVGHDLVRELCELGQWAPNHKRTWPARYALVEGAGRDRLGEAVAHALQQSGVDLARAEKTRSKYLRSPATLVVGAAAGDLPVRTAENRDAVAAGIQNILLAATAAGLATFWSSCPIVAMEAVVELCGFPPGSTVVGLVYLGWPASSAAIPPRPPAQIRFVD